MGMTDRTNETISLSLHRPLEAGSTLTPAELLVDHDYDSSFTPAEWVAISLTDSSHDSDTMRLTSEEAGLLHDRLGLILGRPQLAVKPAIDEVRKMLDYFADEIPVHVYQEIATLLDDIPDCENWTEVPHDEHRPADAEPPATSGSFAPLAEAELRDAIREAIGYHPVPLSIRDHPEIRSEYRTSEDRDGLVDRISAALLGKV